MEIIKLAPEDWKIYKELRLEALQKEPVAFGMSYEEEVRKNNEAWQEKVARKNSCILMAREGGDYFGMTAFYQEAGEKMSHVAYVGGVYIRETHRGQKIGKKLMESILAEIQKNSALTKINLNVNTRQVAAVKLYEALGFQIAGTLHREMKVNGEYIDEYAMEKLL